MLKCIRVNLYKKKLKYNLKLFKFRKSGQVLSLARGTLSSGLWVTSEGGQREETEAAGLSPGKPPPSPPGVARA